MTYDTKYLSFWTQAAADAGIQDMSLDEINEEIRLARESK